MKEFFLHAWRFVQNGGGRFITVDAKNSAIDFYQTFGFKVVEGKEDEIIVPMYLDFKTYFMKVMSR